MTFLCFRKSVKFRLAPEKVTVNKFRDCQTTKNMMQQPNGPNGSQGYTFTQQPQPIATRNKYRDPFSKSKR
jgi:hypothetical protein